jgi:hypothetical protein
MLYWISLAVAPEFGLDFQSNRGSKACDKI